MSEPIKAQDNTDQVAYWNDKAGETWAMFQERIDAVFAAITTAAIDAAAPRPGEHVIDVGCGCGASVLALAPRVGPTGTVFGVDVSRPMLARARERVAAAGLTNAELVLSDAAIHPFPGTADLLFSRFGVMFFADPVAAFANLRRGMRAGGRLLFATWRPMVENSWFAVPLDAARPLLPPQPPADPTAPGPFAFAAPEHVRGVLESAGWRNVGFVRKDVEMPISGPGQVIEAAEFATRIGALARLLVEADEDTRARIRGAVAEALKHHDSANGVALAGSIWLVSAKAH